MSYVVTMMNDHTSRGLLARSIVEADRVCVNSKYVGETVRQKFGLESTTIYDGIDRRFFFATSEGGSRAPIRWWFFMPALLNR